MLKKLLFGILCMVLFQANTKAQTILFSENFNTGSSTNFALNTTDMGGTTAGENPWIINNIYAGGSGTFFCAALSSNFPYTVPAGPQQPAGIAGNPTSYHLHITPQIAINSGGNLPAASYVAADGFCIFGGQSNFARMTVDVSTVGQDSVEFDYWWACGGSTLYYGELYYSTNGGSSWTAVNNPGTGTSSWFNQTTWLHTKITNPAWAQQATLRFGFRFVMGSGTTGSELDPGYDVDDIKINGYVIAPPSTISAPTFSGNAYCPGDNLAVAYTAGGTYTAGNTFTAQLSDAAGSFASPVAIGSVTSTTSGSINATIPLGAAAGGGYRIRVVSSTPVVTSPDNGSDVTIAAGPNAGTASNVLDTVCSGSTTGINLAGYSGSIVWEESADGNNWAGSSYSGDNFTSNPLTQDLYLRAIVQNSCGSDTSNAIHIAVTASPSANFGYSQGGSSLDITFNNTTSGTFVSNSWDFGDGNSSTNNNPTHTYTGVGSYVVVLTVTNAAGCSSIYSDTINVTPVGLSLVESTTISDLRIIPNPNNGQFQLRLQLKKGQDLQVYITDLAGRRIHTLHNGFLSLGEHFIQAGSGLETLSSGLYILELVGKDGQQRHKLSIVR